MNIPNFITVIRFIIIPFFGYFLYNRNYLIAVVFFLLAGFSDFLDGYIARKLNMITNWGKIADPLADKLMQITALVLLTILQKIPSVILVIVLAKEIFMGLGSVLLYRKQKYVVSANWYGKLATVIFHLSVTIIMLFDLNELYNSIFIGISVIATLFAFYMYSLAYRKIRHSSK